ncbi:hypothetical protein L6R29_08355 [Myxococcota bacterium]|nr:hypothetical protein [Myxococcota bacterium]
MIILFLACCKGFAKDHRPSAILPAQRSQREAEKQQICPSARLFYPPLHTTSRRCSPPHPTAIPFEATALPTSRHLLSFSVVAHKCILARKISDVSYDIGLTQSDPAEIRRARDRKT